MTRPDLLALTSDGLAALANRGLVKRAAKDLDAGVLPAIEVDPGGAVHATFPDGVRTTLPPGVGLDASACSCGAAGVCRHRIGAVLAFQRLGDAPAEVVRWSPGDFDDEALTAAFGARAVATARRAHRAGYPALVRRPSTADPTAGVELAACTVRFLVPGELGFVDTDATAARRDELVVLAAWAFRAADAARPDAPEVRLDVGGAAAAEAGSGLADAVALVGAVLLDGAANAGPVLAASVRRVRDDLDGRDLGWPVAALDDLAEQLAAYGDRAAAHSSARVAELLAEVPARHRAVSAGGASLRSRVLGTEERAETPLRRVRLVGLGCRATGTETERSAEVYLADPVGGTVLVLRKSWESGDVGSALGGRRLAGGTLAALSAANVVSESATRSAGREVRIATGRLAKTSITPLGDAWAGLPGTVLVEDFAALAAALADLPPRPVRPRVAAEFVRVLRVAGVRSVGYHPGAQRLDAVVCDSGGTTAVVSSTYRAAAPGALDALAAALAANPSALSGTVRRVGGAVVLDPVAVATEAGLVVLDLAPTTATARLGRAEDERADPLMSAIDQGLAVLAEAAHRGLRNLPAGYPDRLASAAEHLRRVGLARAAAALVEFGSAPEPQRWVDAHLRLAATAEFR